MSTKLYSVKEVCELTGLNRKKLYEYDRSGILKPTHKDAETGYKTYDADANEISSSSPGHILLT